MTKEEYKKIEEIASTEPWLVRKHLQEYLSSLTPTEEKKAEEPRTSQQLKAIWLDCQLIADKLEGAGIDWKLIMDKSKVSVPVTKDSVMSLMWRPVMKALYNFESTKSLKKGEGQIEKIHDVIMRTLGERHELEYHDFPHEDNNDKDEVGSS